MDSTALADLFAPAGEVRVKRMFGGKGVYLDGAIVAVELSDGVLYLKGDAVAAAEYEAAGARRWVYRGETKAGAPRVVEMPYWTMPEVAFDDEDALLRFVAIARAASLRAQAEKTGREGARRQSVARPVAKTRGTVRSKSR